MSIIEDLFVKLDQLIMDIKNGVFPSYSPEIEELAKKAIIQIEKDKNATPEEIEKWAERLADQVSSFTD